MRKGKSRQRFIMGLFCTSLICVARTTGAQMIDTGTVIVLSLSDSDAVCGGR
jgi:hypothetical protein